MSFCLPLLLAPLALAGAPTAVVLPSQGVEGTVWVAMAPADALRRLSDPTWVSSIAGGTTVVSVRSKEGDCVVADYASPSTLMTVRYTVRQCPTGNGYRSTLVKSDDFASYESGWSVVADGAGSTLTYRVQLAPTFPVPVSFITGTMRRDVFSMMQRFSEKLGTP